MTLDDIIDYCAAHNIDGLDPTGYYFSGYPKVPPDDYLYALKRKAYLNGATLNGTGVRNNFTLAPADELRREVRLVQDWIMAAEKRGAAFVRVFSGPALTAGRSRAENAPHNDSRISGVRRLWQAAGRVGGAPAP